MGKYVAAAIGGLVLLLALYGIGYLDGVKHDAKKVEAAQTVAASWKAKYDSLDAQTKAKAASDAANKDKATVAVDKVTKRHPKVLAARAKIQAPLVGETKLDRYEEIDRRIVADAQQEVDARK